MIQKNELKIGNLVLYPLTNKVVYITEILWTQSHSKYNPIPLTLEILDKCGFENMGKHIINNDEITFIKDGINLSYKNSEVSITYVMGKCTIKYLHQLQNLYFALTGEELNIQL